MITQTQPDTPTAASRRRGRLLLVAVGLIFLGPLLVSMALYFGGDAWRPERSTNHGELVTPLRELPAVGLPVLAGEPVDGAPFRGRWTLLVLSRDGCGAACTAALVDTRQVRTLLGRNSPRVRRVLLAAAPLAGTEGLAGEHPDLSVMDARVADAEPLLATLPRNAEEGAIYLSDPNGNLVLRFPAGSEAKALHEDLKRLLKLSRIG